MTMPTDLRHFRASWWSSLHDEEQSRIAGALSVTAIVMLLVTSFTLARGVQWNTVERSAAVEQSLYKGQVAGSTPAAPTTAAPFDCPRLQGRQWLRVAIWQQGDRTLAGWECVYGYANSERFEQ